MPDRRASAGTGWQVVTRELTLDTHGRDQVVDLTGPARDAIAACGIRDGQVTLFVPGATASISTLEYEPGLVADTRGLLEALIPFERDWAHHRTWGDDNGGSHLRALLLGPSLTVPVAEGRLTLGTWQQIVLVDHDTRPRRRRVVVQVMGR